MRRRRTLAALAASLAAAAPAASRAAPGAAEICGARAARYEGEKGFALSVIRAGEVRIVNPLRPLTPEVTQVLEVVIGGKRATAYGPDFTSLHRGGPPNAMQAALGAPISWETALPALPGSLGIVSDDGTPLADLSFRTCETPPAAAPEAPVVAKKERTRGAGTKGTGKTPAAPGGGTASSQAKPDATGKATANKPAPGKAAGQKTPTGFSLPQGAIAE